jgi:hypothetical protein
MNFSQVLASLQANPLNLSPPIISDNKNKISSPKYSNSPNIFSSFSSSPKTSIPSLSLSILTSPSTNSLSVSSYLKYISELLNLDGKESIDKKNELYKEVYFFFFMCMKLLFFS